jgi:acetolactate synthase I/II/III large subunit
VFTGDAGFWNHIGELETPVRWNIPSVTLVNNNGGGNQSKRGFDRVYGGETNNRSREQVNFAKIAEDIGALGIRVGKPNEISSALAKAIESKRPAVIDVATNIEALAPVAVS